MSRQNSSLWNHFYLLIIISVTCASLGGCSGGGGGTTSDTTPQVQQTYTFPVSNPIEVEGYIPDPVALPNVYNKYYIEVREERNIWVGGTPPRTLDYTDIWWTTLYHNAPQSPDPISNLIRDGRFFAPIEIRDHSGFPQPPEGSDYSRINYYFHIGNSSHVSQPNAYGLVEIRYIRNRRLNYEYRYQTGYDLRIRSAGIMDSISSAFADCGTETRIAYEGGALVAAPITVDISIPGYPPVNQLDDYFINNVASPRYRQDQQYQRRTALLVAIMNLREIGAGRLETHQLDHLNALTKRTVYSGNDFTSPAFSVLFMDRITSRSQGDLVKEFKWHTIHELGHQRGLLGHTTPDPPAYSVENGHNGDYKKYCAMHVTSEDGRTPADYSQMLTASRLCEGHKQQLLNIYWSQEENP